MDLSLYFDVLVVLWGYFHRLFQGVCQIYPLIKLIYLYYTMHYAGC